MLERWEATLGALERDPALLAGQLDWVTKYQLLGAYVDRDELRWDDPGSGAVVSQVYAPGLPGGAASPRY